MFSKIEAVCDSLKIPSDGNSLVVWLCEVIQLSNSADPLVNCISHSMVSDIIYSQTGERLSPSNYFHYREQGFDILERLMTATNLPAIYSTKYSVEHIAGRELPRISIGASSVSSALKLLSKHSDPKLGLMVYRHWHQLGLFATGAKKFWPSQRLLKSLKLRNLLLPVPLSHNCPARAARLFKFVEDVIRTDNITCQNDLDEKVLKHCESEIFLRGRQFGMAPSISEFDNSCVQELSSEDKSRPYFYVKASRNGSKIGSADKSRNRVQNSDTAVVLILNSQPSISAARFIEGVVREELKGMYIFPKEGLRDHYEAPLRVLAKLALGICENDLRIIPLVRAVRFVKLNGLH